MEWSKKESDNYIFNYKSGSLAEIDINKIIELQETCREIIYNCLDVKMENKIQYFLCETPQEVGELYGDNDPCNGFAREPNEIYAVYNEKVKCIGFHEDSHIISYNLATPPKTFIREGLAMFFDKVSLKIPNYIWTKFFIHNHMYINIEDLMINENFYKYSDLITYPIAGAFVEYLILNYGMGKFKAFYKSLKDNFHEDFFRIFNVSIENSNTKFMRYINSIGNNDEIFNIIRLELKKRKLL